MSARTRVAVPLREKAEPAAPITPPNTKKDMILPMWNIICGLILCPSLAYEADMERSSPPTTAMQVESDATMPMRKAVP